ncbi:MAG: hypothetical protein ACI88A_002957 [Paraglaciecola sp.]
MVVIRCLSFKDVGYGLTLRFKLIATVYPIQGHGGLKATVNDVRAALPDFTYVMKTDVKQYYQSIDHTLLLKQLDKDIADPFI